MGEPFRLEARRKASSAGLQSSCGVRAHECAGHPEFHIHSGESAVIQPRAVALPGRRAVAAVAVGKHHTVAVARGGELFTWGSNRDGRLGYAAVDTQPTPRRCARAPRRRLYVLPRVQEACRAAAWLSTRCSGELGSTCAWSGAAEHMLLLASVS